MAILRDNWIVIAIAVAVIAALALLIWLWWQVPKWQMQNRIFKSEKERADAEDNFRKTVGQALGGAAVLIGAGAAYLQFTQQQQASHDLLISNQVSKGFEQLGSKEPSTRLGGIYALEGVMNTSAQYHKPVLDALCAFVRDGTIGMIVGEHPATDVQAALTVIGRRVTEEGDRIDLTAARIAGANLSGANLVSVDLRHADLSDADLSDTNLRGANLDSAGLRDADLSHATLRDTTLHRADLFGAILTGAHLNGAYLVGADLGGARLFSTDLRGADLGGVDLGGANLYGADLFGADLSEVDLITVNNLTQAQLDRACGKPPQLREDLLTWAAERPCPDWTRHFELPPFK